MSGVWADSAVPLEGVVSRTLRDVPPADYTFQVDSFSILLKFSSTEKYETNEFEAGGYKWKLALYPYGNKKKEVALNPNGKKKEKVKDHISLYLVIADADKLPLGWEVNVNFKFFVFDHMRDKYLTTEEVGKVWRFHIMKTELGFDHFMSLDEFRKASNGYLVDDCCVFGAEVFVLKKPGKRECLTMKKELYNNSYTWRVANFSSLSENSYYSGVLKIKGWNWKLLLYPKGDSQSDGQSLSLYLTMAECEKLPINWKVYAKYKLRISDQVNTNHHECEGEEWFNASTPNWGWKNFMSLGKLNDSSKDFILRDTIMVEVEFSMLSVVNSFT